MIILNTMIHIVDKTGITLAQCIKIIGSYNKRVAYVDDIIIRIIV